MDKKVLTLKHNYELVNKSIYYNECHKNSEVMSKNS